MAPEDRQRRLKAKNLALGLAIGGLCVLFFILTIVRMGGR